MSHESCADKGGAKPVVTKPMYVHPITKDAYVRVKDLPSLGYKVADSASGGSKREVSWSAGAVALVRDDQTSPWFQAVGMVHEDGHVEGPRTPEDSCRIWWSEYLDQFVIAEGDDWESRRLP